MTHFLLRNSQQSITLLCEFISVWKGRSRVILSKEAFPSQNENIFDFELVQMFGAATNTNKLCIATSGPVLASGEHVTGGLVAARHCSRPGDRPRLGRWNARPVVSTLYALFLNRAPGLVATPGIRKVNSRAWSWRFERLLIQDELVKIFSFSFFSLRHWCKALRQKGRRWHLKRYIFEILGSWLSFNRKKVAVSTKKRTSSGTSRSPTTSTISCFP